MFTQHCFSCHYECVVLKALYWRTLHSHETAFPLRVDLYISLFCLDIILMMLLNDEKGYCESMFFLWHKEPDQNFEVSSGLQIPFNMSIPGKGLGAVYRSVVWPPQITMLSNLYIFFSWFIYLLCIFAFGALNEYILKLYYAQMMDKHWLCNIKMVQFILCLSLVFPMEMFCLKYFGLEVGINRNNKMLNESQYVLWILHILDLNEFFIIYNAFVYVMWCMLLCCPIHVYNL